MSQVVAFPGASRSAPPEDVLGPIKTRVEAGLKDRRRYEPIIHTNRAFAAGRSWLKWSRYDRSLKLDPKDVEGGRERTTVNLLTQYLKAGEAQLAGAEEMRNLLFRREDIPSEDFTKAANDALAYGWEAEWEARRVFARVKRQLIVDGTAAVRCYFDPTVGQEIGQVPLGDGSPIEVMSAEGEPSQVPTQPGEPILEGENARRYVAQRQSAGQQVDFKLLRQGRIRWRNVSFFGIVVPPGIEDEEDFPWEATIEAVAIDRLIALYGEKAKGLQAEPLAAQEMLGVKEQTDDAIGSRDPEQDAGTPGKLDGHVALVTYFERPCSQYPKGRVVTYAGNVLLEVKTELPYRRPNGDYCSGLAYFHYWKLEGRFWGQGLVEPGKKIQKLYNKVCQQEQEIVDRSMPYMLAHKNAKLEVPREIMQVVRYEDTNTAPIAVTPEGPGGWLQAYKEALKTDLEFALGIHNVSLGEEPGGANVPYASLALQAENDKAKVGPIIADFQEGVGRLEEFSLWDMRRYWTQDKLIAIAGEEDMAEAVEFKASKLPEFFMLGMADGAKPRTQAAELSLVSELFSDSENAGKSLPLSWKFDSLKAGKALPLPDEDSDVQRDKARWQNSQLSQGVPVEPMDYDEIAVHIPVHRELQIEAEMAGDMRLWQDVAEHIAADEAMAKQQMAQQAAEQAQAAAQNPAAAQQAPPADQKQPAPPPAS